MSEIKRKNIRFPSDDNTFIVASFESGHEIDGLSITESASGCSGVFVVNDLFEVEKTCQLKVGSIDPLKAIVRWVTKLDDEVIKVGFELLE
jgi:hypothetical protein